MLLIASDTNVAMLDEDAVAQQASPGPPLPSRSILDDVNVLCISRVALSFLENLGPKRPRGPPLACFLTSHRHLSPFNELAGFLIPLRNIKPLPHLHKERSLIWAPVLRLNLPRLFDIKVFGEMSMSAVRSPGRRSRSKAWLEVIY